MGDVGEAFREGFEAILEAMGQPIIIHKNWNTPNATSFEAIGLKNSPGKNSKQNVFQFPDPIDIQRDDVLQIKGGRDLWRVIDTEDHVKDSVFIYFEALVVKITETGREARPSNEGRAVFHAPVYGGVQVGGEGNLQTFSVNLQAPIEEHIAKLIEMIKASTLSELDKDDAVDAAQSLIRLSQKEKSTEVIKRAHSKLETIKSLTGTAKDLADVGKTLIPALLTFF